MSRSAAISLPQQLKSQLASARPSSQLATRLRALVPYIVRDGQWQCGIRPKAPSPHPWRTQHEKTGQTGQWVESYSILSVCVRKSASRARARAAVHDVCTHIYGQQWQGVHTTASGSNKTQMPLDWLVFGSYVAAAAAATSSTTKRHKNQPNTSQWIQGHLCLIDVRQ
jgi:hypothetical protein